jgi:hypothetical protein
MAKRAQEEIMAEQQKLILMESGNVVHHTKYIENQSGYIEK